MQTNMIPYESWGSRVRGKRLRSSVTIRDSHYLFRRAIKKRIQIELDR
jgi:hypothetical protein